MGELTPDELFEALKRAFASNEVEDQYDVGKGATDGFNKKSTYTPHPDYVVGPYNKSGDPGYNTRLIDAAFEEHKKLITKIVEAGFPSNHVDFGLNPNPRVFIAVEDEINSPNRKHRLGSIVNASLLGKVGIASGGPKTYNSLCRIKSYLDYVKERKGLRMAQNVVVIDKTRLISVLGSFD